ncbi:MAG: hypothetical protein ACTHWZ_06650 [Peptoniphilaceae bacterium]
MRFKKYIFTLIFFLTIITTPNIVRADVGPKPSLEIIVSGIEGDYYLDLLVKDKSEYLNKELSEGEKESLESLYNYEDKRGYHPALLKGTRLPLLGELKGTKDKDNTYSHKFSYVGTPEKFKIAILTKDKTLIISDQINSKHFNSIVEFNLEGEKLDGDILYSIGKVKEIIPIKDMTINFIGRLLLTLFIELGLALLFGFSFKGSGKLILKVNILTQVILNIGILFTNLYYGMMAALTTFILMEILIIIFETNIYLKYIKEKTKLTRIIYGILANLTTLFIGFKISFLS